MKYSFLTKELLEQEHIINKKSLLTIAKELNIPPGNMYYLCKKIGFKQRNREETNKLLFSKNISKEIIENEYVKNGKSVKQVADILGVSMSYVSYKLHEYNIPIKPKHKVYKVWNKGLSKNDPRIILRSKKYSETMKQLYSEGKIKPWNKGLTKETDIRVFNQIKDRKINYKRGKDSYWYGKKRTEKTKSLLSLAHGGTGIPYELREYSSDWTEELKESIRKRDNYTCQCCGMTEEEHLIVYGRKLDVHHIDYNKKNCILINLISLCFGCHLRTRFNRKIWEDKFTLLLSKSF